MENHSSPILPQGSGSVSQVDFCVFPVACYCTKPVRTRVLTRWDTLPNPLGHVSQRLWEIRKEGMATS